MNSLYLFCKLLLSLLKGLVLYFNTSSCPTPCPCHVTSATSACQFIFYISLFLLALYPAIKIHTFLAEHHPEYTADFDEDKRTVGSPGDETQMLSPGMNT